MHAGFSFACFLSTKSSSKGILFSPRLSDYAPDKEITSTRAETSGRRKRKQQPNHNKQHCAHEMNAVPTSTGGTADDTNVATPQPIPIVDENKRSNMSMTLTNGITKIHKNTTEMDNTPIKTQRATNTKRR
jgi:hypothetical protein